MIFAEGREARSPVSVKRRRGLREPCGNSRESLGLANLRSDPRQNAESQLHNEFINEWSGVHFSSAIWLQALSFRDPASADWWLLASRRGRDVLTLVQNRSAPRFCSESEPTLRWSIYAYRRCLRFSCAWWGARCSLGSRRPGEPANGGNRAARSSARRNAKIAEWVLAGLFIALMIGRVTDLITNRYYLWSDQITLFGTGPSWWFPERATQFLRDQHLPGNVFGDYGLGGYLTWRLGPEYPDYFDGRFIPFGSELFARHRTLMTTPVGFAGMAEGIQRAKYSDSDFFRGANSAGWEISRFRRTATAELASVYMDDVAVIFLRNTPENADTIHRLGIRCETAAIIPPVIASSGLSRRATDEEFDFLMNAASIDYVAFEGRRGYRQFGER